MALRIKDGQTIILAFDSGNSAGDETRRTRFATEFELAAAKPNFTTGTQCVEGRINTAVCTANGTAENSLVLVDGVFHAHD